MRKYTNDDLQTLLSTMCDGAINNTIKSNRIQGNYIVVNQTNNNCIKKQGDDKIIVNSTKRGLSISRNDAIKYSTKRILLLSDDDIEYCDKYQNIIIEAYNNHPEADIIAFSVDYEDKNKTKKNYKEGRIGRIKALGLSSVQLTFLKNNINKRRIKFDELFGAGSKINFGEDNIFVYDCLRKGLKIIYVPKKIAIIRNDRESTWFKGFDEEYMKNRGAVYYRMSDKLCYVLIIQFAIRNIKKYKNNISFLKSIHLMIRGAKECKKMVRSRE